MFFNWIWATVGILGLFFCTTAVLAQQSVNPSSIAQSMSMIQLTDEQADAIVEINAEFDRHIRLVLTDEQLSELSQELEHGMDFYLAVLNVNPTPEQLEAINSLVERTQVSVFNLLDTTQRKQVYEFVEESLQQSFED